MNAIIFASVVLAVSLSIVAGTCPQTYSLVASGQTYTSSSTCTPLASLATAIQCFTVTNNAASTVTGSVSGCTDVPFSVVVNSVTYTFSVLDGQCTNISSASVATGITGFTYSNIFVFCTTSATSSINISCFSSDSTVETLEHGVVGIGEIQEGDHLKAYDAESNAHVFSKFVAYSHKEASVLTKYIELTTESNRKLKISDYHLIMKVNTATSETEFVYANELSLNDLVMLSGSEDSELYTEKVIALESVYDLGAYAPMTEVGTVIVNSVVASCYANWRSHNLAHVVMPYMSAAAEYINSFLHYKDTTEMAHSTNFYGFFDALFKAIPFVADSIMKV